MRFKYRWRISQHYGIDVKFPEHDNAIVVMGKKVLTLWREKGRYSETKYHNVLPPNPLPPKNVNLYTEKK